MADQKISQLTELTSADAITDVLPVVDFSANETKKIKLSNLPLSDSAKGAIYPYTTDVQSGVIQTRNLTTITNSDGFYNTDQPDSIYIGTNVTSIGFAAFSNSNFTGVNLANQSVTIPDSVTTIGSFAFYYSALTSVRLPDNAAFTSIEDDTFAGCTSLTSVTFGNSVTSIGERAFRFCTGLTSVTIPDSVTSIGGYAFQSCTGLTSATIGNSVTSIGDRTFFDCTILTSVIIPDSVATIGQRVFQNCTSLETATLPSNAGFLTIQDFLFGECNSLTSVTIPDTVTSIGLRAFRNCTSLTSITIPASVNTIGDQSFQGCNQLSTINCYITKDIVDASFNIFFNTSSGLVIHVRSTDNTWTAGTGQSIGGNTNVEVVKDLI